MPISAAISQISNLQCLSPLSPEDLPLSTLSVPASYYEQFDADYSLDVPAEAMGGWQKAGIEIAPEHTAVVVMHAWDIGNYEDYPGWFNACEEHARIDPICREVFPTLLSAVRGSSLRLFHVVGGGNYYGDLPAYQRTIELAGPGPAAPERVEPDGTLERLRQFRTDNVWVGRHNVPDYRRGSPNRTFAREAVPEAGEGIAENGHQLFALCKEAGVNHLVYVGFDINMCLWFSPGGMAEMQQHGCLCSTIRQATTACESKETARQELAKEVALWLVAVNFGFVFDLDDFVPAIAPTASTR